MNCLPRTLLVRTFFLSAALVVLTTTAWLVLFRLAEAEPRARETAKLASSVVNLVRAALLASTPEKRPELFAELGAREGIRLLPAENDDQHDALPDDRYFRLLQAEIFHRLGPDTRVALAVNGLDGFWVSFRLDEQDEEAYWVILPAEYTKYSPPWPWLAWGSLALALALAFAWLMTSRLGRPLSALARAAEAVGRGQTPLPLPEHGALEIEQLAVAFNRMTADLSAHEQERSEVLAGISHDLRTPLTRLRLEAELSVPEADRRVAIVGDLEQMEAVIAQFLDYARGNSGEEDAQVEPDKLLREIAAQHQRPGQCLQTDIAALPPCRLYPRALLRAINNLIENAFRYGGTEVELRARQEGKALCIDLLDRGPGIPESERERVKRPFIRLDQARGNVTGTGLGLAIVTRIAHLHGGEFELLSRPGGGLIARLTLPVRP